MMPESDQTPPDTSPPPPPAPLDYQTPTPAARLRSDPGLIVGGAAISLLFMLATIFVMVLVGYGLSSPRLGLTIFATANAALLAGGLAAIRSEVYRPLGVGLLIGVGIISLFTGICFAAG
jgi:hypothetical protein